jgi:hypothetical protein
MCRCVYTTVDRMDALLLTPSGTTLAGCSCFGSRVSVLMIDAAGHNEHQGVVTIAGIACNGGDADVLVTMDYIGFRFISAAYWLGDKQDFAPSQVLSSRT